jgi:tetratricopeptide (TPR) repeat protein
MAGRRNRYTEVAVLATSAAELSFPRRRRPLGLALRSTAGAVVAAALVAGGAGCADVITNGKSSREEGIYQYDQAAYGEAAGAFANAVRQNPRDYRSHYYLGQSYEKMGQHQQAIHAYKSALDTQYTTLAGKEDVAFRPKVLDGLAGAIARGDTRDVELNFVEQNAKNSQSAEQYWLLAKIYRNRGDADLALDAYNRAALIEPKNFYIQKDHGLYLEQLGQAKRAEPTLKKAYALNTEDADVNAALRRIGVVPGPSLKDQRQLVEPPVPKGPIPPISEWRGRKTAEQQQQAAPTAIAPQPSAQPVAPAPMPTQQTVQAPRD